jgi:hypothetical protein
MNTVTNPNRTSVATLLERVSIVGLTSVAVAYRGCGGYLLRLYAACMRDVGPFKNKNTDSMALSP